MTIQSYAAARQPLQTLLSFGLSLIVSLPMSSRAGTCGCAAIRRRTSGAAGIVEVEGRTQRLFDMVFHAADRPHETDAGDVGRRARATPRSPCARPGSPEIARQSD